MLKGVNFWDIIYLLYSHKVQEDIMELVMHINNVKSIKDFHFRSRKDYMRLQGKMHLGKAHSLPVRHLYFSICR